MAIFLNNQNRNFYCNIETSIPILKYNIQANMTVAESTLKIPN